MLLRSLSRCFCFCVACAFAIDLVLLFVFCFVFSRLLSLLHRFFFWVCLCFAFGFDFALASVFDLCFDKDIGPFYAALVSFTVAGVFDHHIVSFPHLVYLFGSVVGVIVARRAGNSRLR